MSDETKCLQCGENRAAIRKNSLTCGLVDYWGELGTEWPRHRFAPFTAKQLAARAAEDAAWVAMAEGMSAFWDAESKRLDKEPTHV